MFTSPTLHWRLSQVYFVTTCLELFLPSFNHCNYFREQCTISWKLELQTNKVRYFGEGFQISTNQKLESAAFSLLIGWNFIPFPKNRTLWETQSIHRLQTSRLHRVLRNLCCNTGSRTWVLISLISIIQKCTAAKKVSTRLYRLYL